MYNSYKIDGNQKTLITIIVLVMIFIFMLITLPSKNVGVYMHNTSHNWTVTDSNGVALKDGTGTFIKQTKGYHCVLMERSNGEDNHIKSFANDDFTSAKTLYLELKQLESDPNNSSSPSSGFGVWIVLIGIGVILGIAIQLTQVYLIFPQVYQKIVDKLRK